ncbi:hypothetical protein [Metabacillus arenae]|uniref:Transposase n=1 Tax=Metabacillus arenae TaxID=2771434 RepID=A0A926NFD0_9BACI|nr:hypothetical protein [Metabacillus arenae]MBD1383242.1 hypothetical protein [Metabacillus arenae]
MKYHIMLTRKVDLRRIDALFVEVTARTKQVSGKNAILEQGLALIFHFRASLWRILTGFFRVIGIMKSFGEY